MVLLRQKPGPKANPDKLRDKLVDQSCDNDEVEKINEADIPRTSAQTNEVIISEDEKIGLESTNTIDTLKKKLDYGLDNVGTNKKKISEKTVRSLIVKMSDIFKKKGLF